MLVLAGESRRLWLLYLWRIMTPAHIAVFLSHKPSTENGIVRPAILFLAWAASRANSLTRSSPPDPASVLEHVCVFP